MTVWTSIKTRVWYLFNLIFFHGGFDLNNVNLIYVCIFLLVKEKYNNILIFKIFNSRMRLLCMLFNVHLKEERVKQISEIKNVLIWIIIRIINNYMYSNIQIYKKWNINQLDNIRSVCNPTSNSSGMVTQTAQVVIILQLAFN